MAATHDRPLTVLLTDPHLRGGGQVRYVATLARELTKRGHHMIIGCKPDSMLVDRAREAGCELMDTFVFRGGLRPRAWRQDLHRMMAFIHDRQPDLLHVNGSQDHWISAVANRRLSRPVCILRTRHNTYPVHDAWPNRVLNRRWTDYQIVVCETVRQCLARQRGFDETRMCTIHNGVDPEMYRPDPLLRQAARQEFGYADEHIVLGMAARLVPDKGHRFLFEAASVLRNDFPELRLLLLGQGDLRNRLEALAVTHGIAPIVTFGGFRDDMPRCVQAFDIGVQPSIACEASSFSLMEQMAAGKPIVTSDHGGSKEIVRDGMDGYVVPAGTVKPLQVALASLIRDPNRRAEMGRAARQRILDHFTVGIFVDRTLEAYHRALQIHRERTAR